MSRDAHHARLGWTLAAIGLGMAIALTACASSGTDSPTAAVGSLAGDGALIPPARTGSLTPVDGQAGALQPDTPQSGWSDQDLSQQGNAYGSAQQADSPATDAAQTDPPATDPPASLAFAESPRFGLGPDTAMLPPPPVASTAFSAGLLAGNQTAVIARSARVAGAQVDYWRDSHSVVLTINHALVTEPVPDWLTPVIAQVISVARQVWGTESAERFDSVGLDWSNSSPSLVVIDEANSAELLCSPQTMQAFASGEIAVTPEGLAAACQ